MSNVKREYVFEYSEQSDTHLCLSMPNTQRVYLSRFHLHPFFDAFIPEGYLFELLRNLINKREGRADDFTMLYYLAGGVEGRIRLEGKEAREEAESFSPEEVLENDTWDTFRLLLNTFLYRNAISGVQPKTVATLKDKVALGVKEYIVKTFGEEYPELARNEYLCMKAVERAGVKTRLAPAYDVVCTTVYIPDDKPALFIEGVGKSS